MQSSDWQPTLCVAWCLIWWFASIEKVWSYPGGHTRHRISWLRPGVIKQHKPNQTHRFLKHVCKALDISYLYIILFIWFTGRHWYILHRCFNWTKQYQDRNWGGAGYCGSLSIGHPRELKQRSNQPEQRPGWLNQRYPQQNHRWSYYNHREVHSCHG